MKITIKGRVAGLETRMSSHVECEGQETIAYFDVPDAHGTHGSVRLTRDELFRLVAANAPISPVARGEFIDSLHAFADKLSPPRY